MLELLPYEQFPLVILLLRLLSIRDQLLLGSALFLLVEIHLHLLGHEYLESLFLYLFLGFDTLFHFFGIRYFFDLLELYFLHELDVIFVLEDLDVSGLLASLLDFLPGSCHFVLKHPHSVSKELTIFLNLLPDGTSLGVSEIL